MWQILQLLFLKLSFFPLKKWMNLISNRLSTASIKYLNWLSTVFGRFQNGCNKVVIGPRVVKFWSEIILVISNRTHAARLFDFVTTRNDFVTKLRFTQFNNHYKWLQGNDQATLPSILRTKMRQISFFRKSPNFWPIFIIAETTTLMC